MKRGFAFLLLLSLLVSPFAAWAQETDNDTGVAEQIEAAQGQEEAAAPSDETRSEGERSEESEAVDEQLVQLQSAVEEARSAAREALESLPDLAQIATQATQESIGQGQPTLEEQVVYSVSPWTGTEYAGTFAPRQVDTFYLMADEYSLVNVQRTNVYFWPITGEYMADWFGLREEVPGALEIYKDGQLFQRLERTQYSYYFPSGMGRREQKLYLGDEAVRVYEDYQARLDAFYDAMSEYYEAQRAWQRRMDEILQEVRETGQYKDPSEIPEPPTQPSPPTDFAYSPRTAFAVKLPAGRYQVRLVGPDGNVVPDTVKTVEVFEARRHGIGFNVIPEHKWTRSFQSNDPSDIFYLDGHRIFYIVPNYAREFNHYQYRKMSNLHKPLEAEGTRSAWTWAHFEPVTDAKLQVLKDGVVIQEIDREPYYVRQTPGYALGYTIVKFDANDPLLQGRQPTFEAYRVELEGGASYQLRFVDAQGNILLGGTREVRPIKEPGNTVYLIPLLPMAVGLVIFGWRRTKSK